MSTECLAFLAMTELSKSKITMDVRDWMVPRPTSSRKAQKSSSELNMNGATLFIEGELTSKNLWNNVKPGLTVPNKKERSTSSKEEHYI